jgi:hypothetical protein
VSSNHQYEQDFNKQAYLNLNRAYNNYYYPTQSIVEEPGIFSSLLTTIGSTLRGVIGSTNETNTNQIGSRTADQLTTQFQSQAVNTTERYINTQANQFVNQFGFGRTEISLKHIEDKDPTYSVRTIQPLSPLNQNTTGLAFFQGELNSGENADERRATLNLGIGQRYLLDAGQSIVGINLFTDYESSSKHQRVGVGLEYQRANFKANLNTYFPISDKVVIGDNTEEALAGYDLNISEQVP